MSGHNAEHFRQRRRTQGIPESEPFSATKYIKRGLELKGPERLPWPPGLFDNYASIAELMAEAGIGKLPVDWPEVGWRERMQSTRGAAETSAEPTSNGGCPAALSERGRHPQVSVEAARVREDARHAVKRNPEGAQPTALPLDSVLMRSTEPEPSVARGGLAPWQKHKVDRYLNEHLGRPLNTEEIASQVSLSASHFRRAFKKSYGTTPHTHIVGLRLKRALRFDADNAISAKSDRALVRDGRSVASVEALPARDRYDPGRLAPAEIFAMITLNREAADLKRADPSASGIDYPGRCAVVLPQQALRLTSWC